MLFCFPAFNSPSRLEPQQEAVYQIEYVELEARCEIGPVDNGENIIGEDETRQHDDKDGQERYEKTAAKLVEMRNEAHRYVAAFPRGGINVGILRDVGGYGARIRFCRNGGRLSATCRRRARGFARALAAGACRFCFCSASFLGLLSGIRIGRSFFRPLFGNRLFGPGGCFFRHDVLLIAKRPRAATFT